MGMCITLAASTPPDAGFTRTRLADANGSTNVGPHGGKHRRGPEIPLSIDAETRLGFANEAKEPNLLSTVYCTVLKYSTTACNKRGQRIKEITRLQITR